MEEEIKYVGELSHWATYFLATASAVMAVSLTGLVYWAKKHGKPSDDNLPKTTDRQKEGDLPKVIDGR